MDIRLEMRDWHAIDPIKVKENPTEAQEKMDELQRKLKKCQNAFCPCLYSQRHYTVSRCIFMFLYVVYVIWTCPVKSKFLSLVTDNKVFSSYLSRIEKGDSEIPARGFTLVKSKYNSQVMCQYVLQCLRNSYRFTWNRKLQTVDAKPGLNT